MTKLEEAAKGPLPEEKPPRKKPRLTAGPRLREMYWCDFPLDAQLPEFWKTRPVVIIGSDRMLSGAVTVIPCSSQDQKDNKWAFKLTTTVDDAGPSWAICDKPCTVAVSRLSPDKVGKRKVTQDEFTEILRRLHKWLPSLVPDVAS